VSSLGLKRNGGGLGFTRGDLRGIHFLMRQSGIAEVDGRGVF